MNRSCASQLGILSHCGTLNPSGTWSSVLSQVPGGFELSSCGMNSPLVCVSVVFYSLSGDKCSVCPHTESFFLNNNSFPSQGSHGAWRQSTSIWIAFHFTFSRLKSSPDGRWLPGQGGGAFIRWGFLKQCQNFLVWQADITAALCALKPHNFWRIPSP